MNTSYKKQMGQRKYHRILYIINIIFILVINIQLVVYGEENNVDESHIHIHIQFEHSYLEGNEQATISATDDDGVLVWSYTSQQYPAAQVKRIKEIGLYGSLYYYCEDGTITALEAETGNIVWQNGDFGGSPSGWDFDENGNLYICGSLGPYLFIASKDGATLLNDPPLKINYFEPVKVDVIDTNKVKINFIGGPEFREEGFDIIVQLGDSADSTKEVVTYYDADKDWAVEDIDINNYDDLIQKYKTAVDESWDFEKKMNNGLNYLCRFDTSDQIGFSIQDINGDEIDELLIGRIDEGSPWSMVCGMFYDLYTIKDGKPILVVQSGERNRYYLCEGGFIANEGSGGAAFSVDAYLLLEKEGTALELVESVIYDGNYNEQNPWFYSTTSRSDAAQAVSISKEEADAIINKYTYSNIDTTLLS